jgi:hypothetical protein
MSCFQVSDDHIILLALASRGIFETGISYSELTRRASVLQAMNAAAVFDRYDEGSVALAIRVQPADELRLSRMLRNGALVLKQIACYAYQASDAKDYKGSEAERIVEKARHNAIRRLPGYEEAPWGI